MSTPWVTSWMVPADLPAFDGHFPGQPVVPGVVLLARVRELMRARGVQGPALELRQAKFLGMVGPGATLQITVHPAENTWKFDLRDGERVVASGTYARG